MADPKRGATAPPRSGAYRTPDSDGVRDKNESNPYRPPRDGIKDISDINYIPYGGVYEREGLHPYDRVSTGGAYENPTPVIPEIPTVFIASPTYPPLISDSMTVEGFIAGGSLLQSPQDFIATESVIASGTLVPVLQFYTNWPAEEIETFDSLITGGNLVVALVTYSNWPVEEIEIVDSLITGGSLTNLLIQYSNWPEENMFVNGLITGGTLA